MFAKILAFSTLVSLAACQAGHPSLGTPTKLSCVPYARAVSGIQLSGDAWQWWDEAAGLYPRSQTPRRGAVLVFKPYGAMTSGHLAVVTAVQNRRTILVTQSNWVPYRIETNQPVIDVSSTNNWTAVRVWYPPVNAMGVTLYPTNGFILPH